jgi:hypothetical protein
MLMKSRIVGLGLAVMACSLGSGARAASAQQVDSTWEQFDFTRQTIQSTAIETLPLQQLRELRAIVFGRRGRSFRDEPELHRFLEARPWYRADPAFRNSRLTAMERANIDLIRHMEARKHPHIQTGDMRYYRGQVITTAMLGRHTRGDWDVIAGEVEALHGRVFYNEEIFADTTDADGNEVSYLQLYFSERYWYRADTSYSPERLDAIERANLDTIRLARMRDLGLSVAPGMMYLFRDQTLSDTMLRNVTLYDLRILRNEIFARRGRRFTTPWLRDYFGMQSWYSPSATYTDRDLSAVDTANIALITATEARRHEELSTRLIYPAELEGLFPETARQLRNEIFARRGRTFRDSKLQRYFASFAWYRPDPGFSEQSLTEIEKNNVATILAHERRAGQGIRFHPG